MNDPFVSTSAFRLRFESGLEEMLRYDDLGAFILVLANASYDQSIYQKLSTILTERFEHFSALSQGSSTYLASFSQDDVFVFKQIEKIGIENLLLTRHRHEACWQLQYNPLRGLRPMRNAGKRFKQLLKPYDAAGFHFNKPFLDKEVFWQGDLMGHRVRLLYNKFPFAPLHGLLVIDPQSKKSQFLLQQDHEMIWQWLEVLANHIPDMGVGYNALGAFSSVNHQHFQCFVSKKKYPVELACWQHKGGKQCYPLYCERFIDVKESWLHISHLHQENIPYNLLYRQGEMYCVNRQFQGAYEHAAWTGGFAWSEVFGSMMMTSEDAFDDLTSQKISEEMHKLEL